MKDNKKLYSMGVISSISTLIISNIINIIIIPITLKYLGDIRYGIWNVISSLQVFLTMSNFGLNTTMTTLISKANNKSDKILIIKRIYRLLIPGIIIVANFLYIIFIKNNLWIYLVGKIPSSMNTEVYYSLIYSVILILINIPLGLISPILIGFQKQHIDKMLNLQVYILNIVALIILIFMKGNLVSYSILIGSVNLLSNLTKIIYFYFIIYKKNNYVEIKGNKEIKAKEISYKNIILSSMRFFMVSVAAMLVWNTDNLIISNVLGSEFVSGYAVTFKVYNILFTFILLLSTSVMPLIGKEVGQGNWKWISDIYIYLSIATTTLSGLLWIGGILFTKDIISILAGSNNYTGIIVSFSLGGYIYILSSVNVNSSLMTALNLTKGMPLAGWMEALLNLTLSLILVKIIGIGGVALGTFLASLLSVYWILPRIIRNSTNDKVGNRVYYIKKHLILVLIPSIIIALIVTLNITNLYIKLIFASLLIITYVIGCYLLLPNKLKEYVFKLYKSVKKVLVELVV